MGGITQSLFCLLGAARALGSSCGTGLREGAASGGSGDGEGADGQRYLGGAPAPHGGRGRVRLTSGIPAGDSKHLVHPQQLRRSPVLLHPDIGLLGPIRPHAASGAHCGRAQGQGGGGTCPPAPHGSSTSTLQPPGLPRQIRSGRGCREQRRSAEVLAFVSLMTGNSWAGRALLQPPTWCVTPLGAPRAPTQCVALQQAPSPSWPGHGAQHGPPRQDRAASPALDTAQLPAPPAGRRIRGLVELNQLCRRQGATRAGRGRGAGLGGCGSRGNVERAKESCAPRLPHIAMGSEPRGDSGVPCPVLGAEAVPGGQH